MKYKELIEAHGLTLHGDIEHFAELVAAQEREACADIAENWRSNGSPRVGVAEQIRARGNNMTGYQSKRAAAQAIGKVNWADHEPDGLAQPEQEPVDDYTASIIAARNILDAQPVPDFSYIKTYETKSPKN